MGNIHTLNQLAIESGDAYNTSEPFFHSHHDKPCSLQSIKVTAQTNRLMCEYCQEYNVEQFHEQHVRICPCNPVNLLASVEFHSQRNTSQTVNLNPNLEKTSCEYCHQLCYVKYESEHKRICPVNPENIKIHCGHCSRTLNKIMYMGHLSLCEEAHRRRRSCSPVAQRRPLQDMRKVKTNNEISIESCEQHEARDGCQEQKGDCPVCLEELKTKFETKELSCGHKFHRQCINNWSKRQRKCPICRKQFF